MEGKVRVESILTNYFRFLDRLHKCIFKMMNGGRQKVAKDDN